MRKQRENTAPLVLGIIGSAIWILLGTISLFPAIASYIAFYEKGQGLAMSSGITLCLLVIAIGVACLLLTIFGRKKKGAAIALIVFGALTSVILVGIFHLISGIISLKRLKKARAAEAAAANKLTADAANALSFDIPFGTLPFSKAGVSEANDRNAALAYSEILLDPQNLDPVLFRASDRVVYLKQEAVLPFRNGLFAVLTALGEEFESDNALLFVCEKCEGGETLATLDGDDENYAPLAALYSALESGEDMASAAAAVAEAFPESAANAAAGRFGAEADGAAAVKQASIGERSKTKPGKFIVFGLMCAYYIAILILGLLGMCSHLADHLLWTPKTAEEADAVTKVTSMILLALVPSFGYYLALKAPFRRNKIFTIVTGAVSLALTAAMVAVFFVIWGKYRELLSTTKYAASVFGTANDEIMFPVSLALGVVGILLCYAMTFLPVNPNGVRYLKAGKCKSNSFGAVIKHFGISLIFGFRNLFFHVLVFKEKHENAFLLIATVLFSLVLFVIAEIAVILAILVVIMLLISVVSNLYMKPARRSFALSDGGHERNLTYFDYSDGRERYRDDTGAFWVTEDGGSTFYKA